MQNTVVSRDPEIMSGAAVFVGTRVPIVALFDCLAAGETLDDFLEGFPSVTRDQALVVLREARSALLQEHQDEMA